MRRVLVANRGEIALRIVRACFDEELESVLVVKTTAPLLRDIVSDPAFAASPVTTRWLEGERAD
jgi:biotin carboxylase